MTHDASRQRLTAGRRGLLTALALCCAVVPAVAQEQKQEPRQGHTEQHEQGARSGVRGHTFEDTERWVEYFERAEREAWQKPDEVVKALRLAPGSVVADIGAGSGYFAFRLARAVGEKGRVFAVDIEPGMVRHIRERGATEQGGKRVEAVLGEPGDPHLPDGGVDLVLIVNTWHHIADRGPYLERLRQALRPGGQVVLVDFRDGELPVGPPPAHKLLRATVEAEFTRSGWRLAREESFLPYQDMLFFAPPLAE